MTETAPQYDTTLSRDGHVLLRGVASTTEIVEHRASIVDAARRLSPENRDLEDRDTYGKAFLQITNLWQKDDGVKRFVFEKKFAQIAAELLGVERVRLYHDQALFKEPGGGHTPWHQDKRSEEHTSELQSLAYLVCRLLLEKKKNSRAFGRARVRAKC